jgi:AraC-like DNA-binding protein
VTISVPVPLQRAGPFAKLPELLDELGAPTTSVFAPYNIDPSTLRADSYLPLANCVASLRAAAEAAKCEHLGLLLGSRLKLVDLEPLSSLMKSAPTIKEAVFDHVTWQPRYSNAAVAYVHGTRGFWFWGYAAYDRTSIGSRHLYDIAVAAGVRILEELTDGAVKPLEVHLCYSRPDKAGIFENLLKTPVLFNQRQTCLVMADETMNLPLRSHNALLRAELLKKFDHAFSSKTPTVSETIKHYLRPGILRRDASFDSCALRLNVHPRTLRRRLSKEGTSFENLVAEVKCTVAYELLGMTDLSLSEISDALDFSMQSNFSHAFKRWTGVSPNRWRETHR